MKEVMAYRNNGSSGLGNPMVSVREGARERGRVPGGPAEVPCESTPAARGGEEADQQHLVKDRSIYQTLLWLSRTAERGCRHESEDAFLYGFDPAGSVL